MNINRNMDVVELATLMGGATVEEAFEMRSILCRWGYDGLTTYDVPDGEWRYMLDEAVELAAS